MLPRHHLAWLNEEGWRLVQARASDARQREVLARWQAKQWPVVGRRVEDDAGDALCAGIALPPMPDGSKPRLALRVPASGVDRTRPPLLLREVIADNSQGLPPAWPHGMAELEQAMARQGLTLAVFGSLAWQVLTAQTYVRPGSDIDVLFTPASQAELAQGVALLAYHAMQLPLDGEIVFPGEVAVSWKEWRQAAGRYGDAANRVLVKAPDAVRLDSVAALLARLPKESPACTR